MSQIAMSLPFQTEDILAVRETDINAPWVYKLQDVLGDTLRLWLDLRKSEEGSGPPSLLKVV
jgi:hypothetical protein